MSTGRNRGKLSTGELHQVKQLVGAVIALLSFWSLVSLDVGSGFVIFAGVIAAFLALLLPRWVARIPPVTWKWAGPTILIFILLDFALHLPEVVPPLVRMVVLLIIYRVMAPRRQREDLQVILLCLFCLVISGVMTVSLLFAVQILLFTPLAMLLLFIVCLLDRGEDQPVYLIDWKHFRWSRLIRQVWVVFDLRVAAVCAALFAAVVTFSTVLFILTPRFDLNRAIPFLQMSTRALSGFSDEVRLGAVSEIVEDDSVALRIDLPSIEALTEEPYWRMLVLDEYQDGRFRVSESLRSRPERRFVDERFLRSNQISRAGRSGDVWTIYMEGGISRYLPLPGDYVSLRFENSQDLEIIESVQVVGLDSVGQSVFSYRVVDLRFNRRFSGNEKDWELFQNGLQPSRRGGALEYPSTTLELQLDESERAALARINAGLGIDDVPDAVIYSQAAIEYLWQRFRYSLEPDGAPSGGQDPILAWLEGGTRGHCELFAGAFVLMAREAGYPARMAIGFTGGTWNPVEEYFIVRNREAHAWVEIYDPAQQNWLRVDPTPGRSSSDPEAVFQSSLQFESGWFAWVDSLRILWYRRIVNFEQEDQIDLALGLRDRVRALVSNIKEQMAQMGEYFRSLAEEPLQKSIFRLIALTACSILLLSGVWRFRFSILSLWHRVLGKAAGLEPVRLRAARLLRRSEKRNLPPSLQMELKVIRFGPPVAMKEARPVFERVRKFRKGSPAAGRH